MDPTNFTQDAIKPRAAAQSTDFTVEAFSNNTLRVTPPESGPRNPTLFICVLDVSGSMGSLASGNQTDQQKPDVNFSRLDLVKHSMNTLIAGLEEDDHLAIIPFSSTAVVSLRATKMTEEGKKNASSAVTDLVANGGTNIWAGVEAALTQASEFRRHNPIILLLTDGEPNIDPPRGLIPTITAAITSLGLHVPIHTFGFGYDMNSKLIGQVADATSATYAFIPDCSMVGTVFINFIATAMATICHMPTIKVGPAEYRMGAIQYGQPRYVSLFLGEGNATDYTLHAGSTVKSANMSIQEPPEELTFKKAWLEALTAANTAAQNYDFETARAALWAVYDSAPADYRTDMRSSDDNEGQIGKALEKLAWWKRWGRHYLPSAICAHRYEVCNNFKDKAIQQFGGDLFREHQARLEALFLTIPPPVAPVSSTNLYSSTGATRSVDMSYFHNLGGGCFGGGCHVRTPDGTKLVRDVKKGDILTTVLEGGHEDTATVVCVVVSKPPGGKMDIVTIGGLKITPWHPMKVFADGQWVFPAEAFDAVQGSRCDDEKINEVYTFVLDRGHTCVVEDYIVCGLGHGLKGPVIGHDYFGTDAIINDLKRLEGWEEGRVLYNDLKNLTNK
jgi:Mg-chelatase subunit ChlD